ncbi:hypothetical protein BGZ63DRAFT_95062 [Mariannaea sp. PMI_226]|nr:hypothetical protein BGZ63DRAFT_95062 [Mariannaea sp. PMI_226]
MICIIVSLSALAPISSHYGHTCTVICHVLREQVVDHCLIVFHVSSRPHLIPSWAYYVWYTTCRFFGERANSTTLLFGSPLNPLRRIGLSSSRPQKDEESLAWQLSLYPNIREVYVTFVTTLEFFGKVIL